jgi:hypothetical protein
MVIVHPNPDLDAVTCIALSGARPEDVHFLPAGITEIPSACPCCGKKLSERDRILDHPLGEKGRLDADGTRHAAACSMSESQTADPLLLKEVDEQDSTGKIVHPRFSLASVLAAVRSEASERGLRGANLDREVVRTMSRIITGLNILNAKRQEADNTINGGVRIVEIGSFKFAILPEGETSPQMGIVLNEKYGVTGHIYAQQNNVGVTRYPGHDKPDLLKLKRHLSGWFIHTAGFLACWGSRKSPATVMPPEGTPQNQEELLALMREVFG